MVQLTDRLPESNFTPQAIGGAPQTSIFEGLAKTGSDLFSAIDERSKSAKTKENSIAEDELAMQIFEGQTDLKIGDPGYNEIVFQKRLAKAAERGNITAAEFDVRTQGTLANLMRKYPNEASEILKRHKEFGYLSNEAKEADKARENQFNWQEVTKGKLLTSALETGEWDGKDIEEGIGIGLKNEVAKTKNTAIAAQLDQEYKHEQIVGPKRAAYIKELQSQAMANFLGTAEGALTTGWMKANFMAKAAVDDITRKQSMQSVYREMKLGLFALERNGNLYMDKHKRSWKDKDDVVHTYMFDEGNRAEFHNWIQSAHASLDALMTYDIKEQQQFLERYANNDKITAQQKFPTLIAMANGLYDGSIPAMLDGMIKMSEQGFISAEEADTFIKGYAEGITSYKMDGFPAIADMTKNDMMPSSNPTLAKKAFGQNTITHKMLGGVLATSDFSKVPDSKPVVLKNYSKAMTDALYAVRDAYTPNSITVENTEQALKAMFNDTTLKSIDGFEKQNGDANLVKLYRSQSAIGAATFVEGLLAQNPDAVKWDPISKRVVALPSRQSFSMTAGASMGGSIAQTASGTSIPLKNQTIAAQINSLNGYIEKVNLKEPVVREDILKASGKSVTELLVEHGSLQAAVNAAADIASTQAAKSSKELFQNAVNEFEFNDNPFNDPNMQSMFTGQDNIGAIDWIMEKEGSGFVADDNGRGPSKYGILASANGIDPEKLKDLTEEDARQIYQDKYVDPVLEANVPPEAQLVVINSAVNQGVPTALKLWENSGGDVDKFVELVVARYRNTAGWDKVVTKDGRTQLDMWLDRVEEAYQRGPQMAQQHAEESAPPSDTRKPIMPNFPLRGPRG